MIEPESGQVDRTGPRPLLDGDKQPKSPSILRKGPLTAHKTVHRKPLLFCRLIAKYPNIAFGIMLSVHMFFALLSAGLMIGGYDLFPMEFESLPINLYNQPWFKRELAIAGKWNFTGRVDVRDDQQIPEKKDTNRSNLYTHSLALLYDGEGANVLTPRALRDMRRIEDSLTTVPGYAQFCQQHKDGKTCMPAQSLLRLFDGTVKSLDPVFDDPEFHNITGVIYEASINPLTKDKIIQGLGKGSIIEPNKLHVSLVRSIIAFGASKSGLNDQEKEDLLHFIKEYFQPKMNHYVKTEKAFSFMYYQEILMIRDAREQAFKDMCLSLGSLSFIFLFILFYTRSLLVTCLSAFSILCSFLETNLVYRVLLDFQYFGYFHVLVIFIILGIGADDLFVFWDAWKAAGLRYFTSLAHRLDATYRRAVISMLITSLTTMLAFLISAGSPMLATKSFGIFSAILVMLDYVSVITFFPSIVLFHHIHFENKPWCGCSCFCLSGENRDGGRGNARVEAAVSDVRTELRNANADTSAGQALETAVVKQVSIDEAGPKAVSCVKEQRVLRANSSSAEYERPSLLAFTSSKALVLQLELRWMVRFFRDYYYWLVTHRVYRWFVLGPALAFMIGMAYSASNLEPDNKQVGLFVESHQYTRAFRSMSSNFIANWNDYAVLLDLVWGMKEQDMSVCHFSDYKCSGRTVFDDTFNPDTRAAQLSFVKLCDTLFNFTDQQIKDFAIKRDSENNQTPMIYCFTKTLNEFLKEDPFLSSVGANEELPWERPQIAKFALPVMTKIGQVSAASTLLNPSFTHYLDVPVNYFIHDGYAEEAHNRKSPQKTWFGEEETEFSRWINISSKQVMIGNKIKWMVAIVGLNLKYETLSYREHLPIVEKWELFMSQQLSLMPPEMQSGFQSCKVAWHMLFMQQALVFNAVTGIVLGLCFSLPILVVSTCSFTNGLLSVLTICGATACVVGVIPLAGWKLGILVSLNMCLVVGLAVDYVVHLAEGYHMAKAHDRKGRVRHSLETMASSVFSGACTTLGASVFLLFSQIQFFYQFGLFMFCTIGFSLVFSLTLYIPVMGILGPEGHSDIRVSLYACLRRLKILRSDNRSSPKKDDTIMDPSESTASQRKRETPEKKPEDNHGTNIDVLAASS